MKYFQKKHHQSLFAAIIEKTVELLNTATVQTDKTKKTTSGILILTIICVTVTMLMFVFSTPDRWIRI